MSVDSATVREHAAAELAAWRAREAPATPLHRAAAPEEQNATAALKSWQADLDAVVTDAAVTARRKGLGQREQRRAAARAAETFMRKHPRP